MKKFAKLLREYYECFSVYKKFVLDFILNIQGILVSDNVLSGKLEFLFFFLSYFALTFVGVLIQDSF